MDGLEIDSGNFRVGVTTFSDVSRLEFNLNDFTKRDEIEAALRSVNIKNIKLTINAKIRYQQIYVFYST